MPKLSLKNISKTDIQPLAVKAGGTAIVLQRQEQSETSEEALTASSLQESAAEAARLRDLAFFKEVFKSEGKTETYVLFISTDDASTDSGKRSIETVQLAKDAAMEVLDSLNIDPAERIITTGIDFALPSTILGSGNTSIHDLKQFSEAFHIANTKKRLIIWVAAHYDTMSPFIEQTVGTTIEENITVTNGGGVVIQISPGSKKAQLHTKSKSLSMSIWHEQLPRIAA